MSILLEKEFQFTHVPFSTINQEDKASQMGLIILETDLTIETEFRKFLSQDKNVKGQITLLNTRIPCDDKVTAKNLTSMETRFTESLKLFPNNYEFDVIGYGCTSASLLIGDEKITKIIKSKVLTNYVTTPMLAIKKALRVLGAKKIGYIAPYISDIAHKMCSDLTEAGFSIVSAATFNEDKDSIVGIITPESIFKAVETLTEQSHDLEAIFISCTSLKCKPIIPLAEERFKVPILSSNSTLAWDMVKLSKADVSKHGKGILFNY